ncbi:MAG TPA: HAMP domain-containing sensor histidine kinase [Chloroflexota bacterium]|nr:HAMP domain-containing sensor histidine kinase [Chloroflexota bacterium]
MIHSLRARLILVFGGLTLLSVALFAIVTAGVLERMLLRYLSDGVETQAQLIAGRVAHDLASENDTGVQEALSEIDTETTAHVLVVDARRRQVGVSEPGDRQLLGLPSENRELREALEGRAERTVLGRGSPSGEVLYVALPIIVEDRVVGAVRLAYQLEDLQQSIDALNLAIGAGALGMGVIAAVLAAIFASSISAPVRALNRATRALSAGDLEQRAAVTASDEIGQLAESFNELAAQLAELETSRREFAADVSHELRSLAGAMHTGIQALAAGADRDPQLRQDIMDGLSGHGDRLVRLADDIQDLAGADGVGLAVELSDASLSSVVRQAVAEWSAEALRRSVSIETEEVGPATIKGDHQRLVQATGNLIENALKYAGNGGRIVVRTVARPGGYAIEVEDNGPGIAATEKSAIFRRSYRVEGRTGEGPGGMGLGLAIVDRIARAHGGEAAVRSQPGHGATFVIRLPSAA